MGTEVVPARDLSPRAVEVAALEAMKAVENVETPEEADRLLRMITAYQAAVKLAQIGRVHEQRWAGVRLRAERKMGELLGPATTGGQREGHVSGTNVEGAERVMQHQARKLAAVPADVFAAYVETAEEPTRAGLLREAAKRRPPPSHPSPRTVIPKRPFVDGPSRHLPDILSEETNVRDEVVNLCDRAHRIRELLDNGCTFALSPIPGDKESLLSGLGAAAAVIQGLKTRLRNA